MSDPAYLILNGPHRGMKQQAINGPVLRLENNGIEDLWEMPRVITYTLQTLAVADDGTQKSHSFWLTEDTKQSAITMVDLLVDLAGEVNDG
jgi:hypothetical protein